MIFKAHFLVPEPALASLNRTEQAFILKGALLNDRFVLFYH